MIIPRWCHNTGTFGFVPWQLNNLTDLTARAPYPLIHTIENKNVHIFVLNGILCHMGHVHCGIYENCQFIISSGLAWCHRTPDLCLVSNSHGRLPNKFERNPTTLIFLAGGREEGAVRQALWQHHLCRDGLGGSHHQATKYVVGKLFQVSTDSKQIWHAYWVIA